ncbi:MAG: Holliday junction branch migration protein RuvA [Kiritimatiellae bacterium]|nr:Holliday junction branch migration protein RuvA [Kiritimatiellia bacterium]
MITFLEGTLVEKSPARVVVRVGGVGYEVFIPLSSFDRLPAENRDCRLLVYEYLREDLHSLFGFASEAERRAFILLMNVNGIGPKLAMSALSSLAVSDLNKAIAAGDIARLTTIAGIGKKTAERMVVELRDKLSTSDLPGGTGLPGENIKTADAILALVSLGYKQNEAARMVSTAAAGGVDDMPVEEIIRRALRR